MKRAVVRQMICFGEDITGEEYNWELVGFVCFYLQMLSHMALVLCSAHILKIPLQFLILYTSREYANIFFSSSISHLCDQVPFSPKHVPPAHVIF